MQAKIASMAVMSLPCEERGSGLELLRKGIEDILLEAGGSADRIAVVLEQNDEGR